MLIIGRFCREKYADGTLHLEIDAANPPTNVSVWSAKTIDGPLRRDFRLVAIMNNTNPPGKPFLHPVWWYQQGQFRAHIPLFVHHYMFAADEFAFLVGRSGADLSELDYNRV